MKKYLLTLIISACVLLAAQREKGPPLKNEGARDPSTYSTTGGRTSSGVYTRFGSPGGGGGGGGGTVNSGTAGQIAYYATTGSVVNGDANFSDNGSALTAYGGTVCTSTNGACPTAAPGIAITGGNVAEGFPPPPDTVAPNNQNSFPAGSATWNVFNPGAIGPSQNQYLPGSQIKVPCSTWKVQVWQNTGTATLSFKMQIYKVDPGHLTVLATTQVKFGGSATPSFSTPGTILTSDTTSFAIDTDHDYYLVVDQITGLPAIGAANAVLTPGVWVSTADNYGVAVGAALNLAAGSPQTNKSLIVRWIAQS